MTRHRYRPSVDSARIRWLRDGGAPARYGRPGRAALRPRPDVGRTCQRRGCEPVGRVLPRPSLSTAFRRHPASCDAPDAGDARNPEPNLHPGYSQSGGRSERRLVAGRRQPRGTLWVLGRASPADARAPAYDARRAQRSEQRVAELVARGVSNKEIAAQLFVSVYTVEAHLSTAYAKLGVRSRKSRLGASA